MELGTRNWEVGTGNKARPSPQFRVPRCSVLVPTPASEREVKEAVDELAGMAEWAAERGARVRLTFEL
jgi:hypothetical protein